MIMIFDKNVKRIKELSNDPMKNAARIRVLRSRGPEWWIQYYDSSRRLRAEKCPPEYQNQRGAKKFESIRIGEIAQKKLDSKEVRHVRLSTVIDAYLEEHMNGRPGASSARSICKHINRLIGHWWLDHVDEHPQILVDHFRRFPEKDWSDKYIHNYFIVLRAAMNHWIRFRRLQMQNPCNLVVIQPNVRVLDYVPTQEDFEKIIAKSIEVGLPDWIRNLLTVVFETGLRINEVMKQKKVDVCLDPKEGLPYIWIWESKQKRQIRSAKPLTRRAAEAYQAQISSMSGEDLWPVKNPPYGRFEIKQEDGTHKTLFELAGVPIRPFHDYRKSAKLRFKTAAGRDAAKAMQGHRTDSMDDYYTFMQRKQLEAAVAQTWRDDNDQRHDQK
jgi:integrase